jgi:hypothetical protein
MLILGKIIKSIFKHEKNKCMCIHYSIVWKQLYTG